jgi:hypothetical protein
MVVDGRRAISLLLKKIKKNEHNLYSPHLLVVLSSVRRIFYCFALSLILTIKLQPVVRTGTSLIHVPMVATLARALLNWVRLYLAVGLAHGLCMINILLHIAMEDALAPPPPTPPHPPISFVAARDGKHAAARNQRRRRASSRGLDENLVVIPWQHGF